MTTHHSSTATLVRTTEEQAIRNLTMRGWSPKRAADLVADARAPIASVPDLAANIAAAQHAGDLAYAFAERAGASLPDQSIAYHVAFAETMREKGSPMPCPCDLCTAGGEPADFALVFDAITVEEELARR